MTLADARLTDSKYLMDFKNEAKKQYVQKIIMLQKLIIHQLPVLHHEHVYSGDYQYTCTTT